MAIQSSNPVFNRAAGFNGRNAPATTTYPGNGQGYAGYGQPATWSTGAGVPTQSGYGVPPTHEMPAGRMSVDSVVQKTGVTLVVLLIAAAATWLLTGNPTTGDALGGRTQEASDAARTLYVAAMVGAFGAFALSMVNSFKRIVSPPLVLAFAALEGVALGAISKIYQLAFGEGIVIGAVIGTVAAFAGTLVAYRVLNIKVGDKFRKYVVAAGFGMVALLLLDFVLSFFNVQMGISGFGPVGFLFSVLGLALGVFFLILDFDFVERGVAAGLPENESWRAAFGLTVSLVWIYINLLRILAILRN